MRGSMSENQGELHGGGNTRWPFIGRKTLPAGGKKQRPRVCFGDFDLSGRANGWLWEWGGI